MQQQQQQQAMANDKDSDDGWLAALEDDYVQSIGAEPDYEHQYAMERDASMRAMWTGFQESATSIAQLYRDRLSTNETGALWLPFQTAAGTVTTLYKESSDGLRRTGEAAIRSGYQRRTRELADWARKKNRRYIRREELLAYLAGKPPPPLHGGTKPERSASAGSHHHPHHHPGQSPLGHHHLHHHHSSYGGAHNNTSHTAHLHGSHHHQHHQHHHLHHSSHHAANTNGATGGGVGSHTLLSSSSSSSPAAVAYLAKAGIGCVVGDVDGLQQQQQSLQHQEGADGEQLHTFKEALARRPRAPDLYAFVTDEIARHSKRPASPLDINMDAQQNIGGKRTRFL